MQEIRAFVGHSFAADDKAVVHAFLAYFSTLQSSPLNFSWVSAERAEPTELAAKVLRLIGDRNTFIAICTRKQLTISCTDLIPTLFPRGFLKADSQKFRWKTSDWITQEIGLAIGKGLELILLLETGVEKPGGLQGNIEHIEFDRETPEACFDKILQMIITLLPKVPGLLSQATDPRSSPSEPDIPAANPSDDERPKPGPDATQYDYDMVLMHLVGNGDDEGLKQLNLEYAKTALKTDGDNAVRWEALTQFCELAFGTRGSIAQLERLVSEHPESSSAEEQLGRGLSYIGEPRAAAVAFERAANKTLVPNQSVLLLAQSARAFARANQHDELSRLTDRMRAAVEANPEVELHVLRAMAAIARGKGDLIGSIPSLERVVELVPDDYDARFSLAYAYSQNSNDGLALLHYTRVPEDKRDASTWNNIGASSDVKGLPARAVEAYRKAESESETLAMSNLATKFLKAGFLSEALALCAQALNLESPHQNVGVTWAEAKEVPENERKLLSNILDNAGPISDFYRQLGRAEVRTRPDQLPPVWIAPEGVVNVKIKEEKFTAEGSYEVIGLAALLSTSIAYPFGIASAPAAGGEKYLVTYRGTLSGRAVHGTVHRRPERTAVPPQRTSLLSEASEHPKVLIVLTDDGSEMKVMEQYQTGDPRFYSIRRQI